MAKIDDVHRRVNEIYESRKGYVWDGLKAPEQRPQVQSNQVLALMEVLVGEIEVLTNHVKWLENHIKWLEGRQ